jgi:O-antigen/teichoic acid export membrane protein
MTAFGPVLRASQRVTRRRVLVMCDQAASSLSNIVVAVLVARSFDTPEPFGAFGLAMVAYQLALGVARSLVGEALLSLYSNESAAVRRRLVGDLIGATLSVGLIGSVTLWAVSGWLGGLSGDALVGLAVVLPLVLIQDMWRYVFVIDRPGSGLALDVVWLVVVVGALLFAPADAGVTWFVLMWGLGGAFGAVLGFVLNLGPLGGFHPWRWVVDHRAVTVRFLGETFTARALFQVLMSGLGAIAGLGALGAVRATQLFYGPLNTLNAGIYMAVVPEGAAARHEPERLRRKLATVSAALASLVAGWMLVGLMLPDRWGRAMLGTTWEDAEGLMLPMGLATIASAVMIGGLLGLRSLADAKRSLQARLKVTPWLGVCPLLGAVIDGARGFAIGTALGTAMAALIWWATFRAALNDVETADESTSSTTPHGGRQAAARESTAAWLDLTQSERPL